MDIRCVQTFYGVNSVSGQQFTPINIGGPAQVGDVVINVCTVPLSGTGSGSTDITSSFAPVIPQNGFLLQLEGESYSGAVLLATIGKVGT